MEAKAARSVNGVDLDRLQKTFQAISEVPTVADFKFRATNTWVKGAKNISMIKSFYGMHREDHSRSQAFALTCDYPEALLGTNHGPNPLEVLLHALASCLTTTMIYHATANGIKINDILSTYEGNLDLHGFLGLNKIAPKGFKKIKIGFYIRGDLTSSQKEEILNMGRKYSPVYSMIAKSVTLEASLK